MLLVPYPKGASRGDQIENAASLEKRGLSAAAAQEQMTPDSLSKALQRLMADREALAAAMAAALPADGSSSSLP